jgi:large subunit ribosomal protein L15
MSVIKLHDLRPAPGEKKAKTRVGRGEGSTSYEVVNLGDISRLFPAGGDITLEDLVAKGAVRKNTLVKVLGDGKLTVKVNVTAHKFSGSAREKITAAGGSATEVS